MDSNEKRTSTAEGDLSVIPFNFEGTPIRTLRIDGEAWFVGKDVAERLGYADPTNAMKQHCKGVVKRHPLQTAGGVQELRILSEPDVLRLIVKSNLPEAERFEHWVFEEVLPSIRRTGGYIVAAPEETPLKGFLLRSVEANLQRGGLHRKNVMQSY